MHDRKCHCLNMELCGGRFADLVQHTLQPVFGNDKQKAREGQRALLRRSCNGCTLSHDLHARFARDLPGVRHDRDLTRVAATRL